MIGMILCGHGTFPQGLYSAMNLIVGPQKNVNVVNFTEDVSTDDLKKKLSEQVLAFTECEHILFLCDLVGGTPYKTAIYLQMEHKNLRVIGGVNLGMLLEAVFARETQPIDELVQTCLDSVKSSIQEFHMTVDEIDMEGDEL